MVTTNELRIGNYVYSDNRICTIKSIEEHHIEIKKEPLQQVFNKTPIKFIKPIALTEEILLKCGFKHLGNGFYEILGSFISLCNIGDVFFNAGFKGVTIGNIKYLHQLQNLYLALTGQELNVKL